MNRIMLKNWPCSVTKTISNNSKKKKRQYRDDSRDEQQMASEEGQIDEPIALDSSLYVAIAVAVVAPIAQVVHKKRDRKPKIQSDNPSQIGRPTNARDALETSPAIRCSSRFKLF